MISSDAIYANFVFLHVLLLVVWLGADIGVFILGQHFRKRERYTLDQRVALLKLLVIVDLGPRVAWAMMVPVSLTMLQLGGWWQLGWPAVALAWAIGAWWTWFILAAHARPESRAVIANRRFDPFVKLALMTFYLWLGAQSLLTMEPLAPRWLALKALGFGLIFLAAMMIDVRFKPVGALLGKLLAEGSNDSTEIPLRAAMDRTRKWVLTVYALVLATAWLGVTKMI